MYEGGFSSEHWQNIGTIKLKSFDFVNTNITILVRRKYVNIYICVYMYIYMYLYIYILLVDISNFLANNIFLTLKDTHTMIDLIDLSSDQPKKL